MVDSGFARGSGGNAGRLSTIAGIWWLALAVLLTIILFAGMWTIAGFVVFALWTVSSLVMALFLIVGRTTKRAVDVSVSLAVVSVLGAVYGLLTSNSMLFLIQGVLVLAAGAGISSVIAHNRLRGAPRI